MNHNDLLTLKIENFQSHEKTIIKFAPGGQLTVITGQTDSGKTAIFRALRWLLYNQPQGTDFIRGGCTFARVTGEYASGHTIIRERTASKNQYRIDVTGNDTPVVLEGFGNAVPFEVQEITGIRTVTIGDMDFNLNMAEQLDGPFLGKSVSSGTRAKVIGKLAGTEVLDHAGKTVGTDLYRRNQDEKRLTAEVDGLLQLVGEYDYLPVLKSKIEAVDQVVELVKANKFRWGELFLLKSQIESKDKLIASCNEIINRWQFVDVAGNMAAEIVAKLSKMEALEQLGKRLKSVNDSIANSLNTINRLKNIDAARTIVTNVAGKIQHKEAISNIKNRSTALEVAAHQCQVTINRFNNIEEVEQIFNRVCDSAVRLEQMFIFDRGLATVNHSISEAKKVLDKLSGLDDAEALRNTVEYMVTGRQVILMKFKNEFGRLNIAINDLKGSVIIHEQRVAQLEGAYKDELVAAGICPLCGAVTNSLFLEKAG